MTERNQIAERARKLVKGNPTLEAAMREAWGRVTDKIHEHVSKSPKKWKVYEAHHLNETARLAFLTACVEGRSVEVAETEAWGAVA